MASGLLGAMAGGVLSCILGDQPTLISRHFTIFMISSTTNLAPAFDKWAVSNLKCNTLPLNFSLF